KGMPTNGWRLNQFMSKDKALALEINVRTLKELGRQNLSSVFVYPVIWAVLAVFTQLLQLSPSFFWINSAVLALTTLSRATLSFRLRNFSLATYQWREDHLIATTMINAAHWGVMTALCLVDSTLEPLRWPMLLCTTAIASSSAWAQGFHSLLRVYLPLAVALPPVVALVMIGQHEMLMVATLSLVFLGYLMFATRARQDDYLLAVKTAVELEQRTKELEYTSFTDAVTRLHNRAYFDVHLELEWKRAFRQRYPMSLLIIDLDHFKLINDR